MNALTKIENTALSAMTEQELIDVLQTSLYPGAAPASIKMVLGYCKATGLDPMQKPVHIVPMWDSKAKAMRDVVMPGIGLYRTQAARTNRLAGISEPEFGPDKVMQWGEFSLTVPEWCRVTVRRLVDGEACEFTAREFWIENYATAGKDTTLPNAMWKKRPRGQLAKCAQAQALRMAFPEVGEQSTADEMEGKVLDMGTADVVGAPPPQPAQDQTYPQAEFDKNLPSWTKAIQTGKKTADGLIAMVETKAKLTDAQKAAIKAIQPPTDATPKPATDAPAMTYAEVAEALHAATDPQKLGEAADLIGAVPDEQQRAELSKIYHQRREAIGMTGD